MFFDPIVDLVRNHSLRKVENTRRVILYGSIVCVILSTLVPLRAELGLLVNISSSFFDSIAIVLKIDEIR